MELVFWVCTILLALAALGGAFYTGPGEKYVGGAFGLLVAIDLIILGVKVLGTPH